jgi:hypothetical protein
MLMGTNSSDFSNPERYLKSLGAGRGISSPPNIGGTWKSLNAVQRQPSAESWVSLALSDFAMLACRVQLKRASTGAWSLVPTSLWTKQAVARTANEMLANT